MRNLSDLWIDRSARPTLQDQLARQIRERIRSGDLAPGDSLPSTRDLATELKVSRNTAVYAYERLMSEGYLESSSRACVFVSPSITIPREPKRTVMPKKASTRSTPAVTPPLSAPKPFRPCQPDVGLFPLLTWNRMRGRALRREGRNILHYQASCIAGLPALRENVATYLRDHRGVRCDSHQVVITSGSQQALFLLAMLLLEHGDRAYVEDPGYVEARLAWRNAGARIVPGRIDEEGLRLPDKGGKISLIYTTPSRQFPTGVSLSLARRLAFIDYATRNRCWIIEDDYDSELRYGAAPLPSLQSLDTSGRLIYTGTFSKVLFPSLRLGYVVVPDALVDRFIELKHLSDDHLPLLDQATLALFLESGAFYSHIRRCRREYASRHALFLDLFAKAELPLTFEHTDGGMNVVAYLPEGSDDVAWSNRLQEAGFDVPALSHYAIEPTRPGLVFGFTAFTDDTIRSEFKRMRPILEELAARKVKRR
ncbi:MAG TPA: PLP-dependent aminotransferase family protein [Thermoanaerobaculia bacterium]|nr:PLP-dependent aminotransferase family protein [Thermoanaerobaculia bacterium]